MPLKLKSEVVTADDIDEAVEKIYRLGWTDGLPVVLPTESRIVKALEYLGRDPQESLGVIGPRNGEATIEMIVINSIMGGCLPEHIPVVIAAVEGMQEKDFNINGVQTTTHTVCPLAIVSGPAVKDLGFNCGDGVFGGGSRSNAAVGRAIRLILWNIGGAFPGDMDRATMGHPGKYVYCIAENAEGSPWEPIHVEAGFKAEDSAVTMFGCEAPHHLATGTGNHMQTLAAIADGMSTITTNNFHFGGQMLVVFGPRAATNIATGGWTRSGLREFFYENARVPVKRALQVPPFDFTDTGSPGWPKWVNPDNPNAAIPVLRRPQDFNLVVAGGWGAAAAFCAICPGWGYLGGLIQTKRVQFPGR